MLETLETLEILKNFLQTTRIPRIHASTIPFKNSREERKGEQAGERIFFPPNRKIYYPRVQVSPLPSSFPLSLSLSFPRATLSRANWQVTRCNKFAGGRRGVRGGRSVQQIQNAMNLLRCRWPTPVLPRQRANWIIFKLRDNLPSSPTKGYFRAREIRTRERDDPFLMRGQF